MYTLEIGGVAVAMTDADEAEAREIFLSDDFKEDLGGFTSGGKPIWDGKAAFVIRVATEEESDLFDDAMDEDEFEEEAFEGDEPEDDGEDGASIMFLLDVDQLEDDLED